MPQGRACFDSLQMATGPRPHVVVRPAAPDAPPGEWLHPRDARDSAAMLYLHGGGYAFDPAVTRRFAAGLAERLQLPAFYLHYRLAPEHPHPAQLEDALRAWRHLLDSGHAPERLVICGDSAGGHLALMLIAALRDVGLPQPAITLALCPWTDVGRRGDSQFAHDVFDMLQGDYTLQFGRWFRGATPQEPPADSPMTQAFHDVSPVYLQAGGREILVDMIRDFARHAGAHGAAVRLDTWPAMPHDFQAYEDALPESRDALGRIADAVTWALQGATMPPSNARTEFDTWQRTRAAT
ncbi:MAG: alpha/beta hydrolase [Luteimonas sp.]